MSIFQKIKDFLPPLGGGNFDDIPVSQGEYEAERRAEHMLAHIRLLEASHPDIPRYEEPKITRIYFGPN